MTPHASLLRDASRTMGRYLDVVALMEKVKIFEDETKKLKEWSSELRHLPAVALIIWYNMFMGIQELYSFGIKIFNKSLKQV